MTVVNSEVYLRPFPLENVADTEVAWLSATEQEPVPVQAPVHPRKLAPVAGAAVRVTVVPLV